MTERDKVHKLYLSSLEVVSLMRYVQGQLSQGSTPILGDNGENTDDPAKGKMLLFRRGDGPVWVAFCEEDLQEGTAYKL
jgi:hypothetical protein